CSTSSTPSPALLRTLRAELPMWSARSEKPSTASLLHIVEPPMRRIEMKSLVAGLLIGGIVVAAALVIGGRYLPPRGKTTSSSNQAMASPVESMPAVSSLSQDSIITVDVGADEQQRFGVETVEVRRQTIRKEIAASGRVVEPETGVGVISARITGR